MFSRIKNINMSTGFFIPSPAICLSGRTWDGWGVKNLNVGNCDDAPSTAGSSNYYYCYCYCFCYCYCYYFRGTCARWERLLSWGTGNGAGVQFVILLYTFCFLASNCSVDGIFVFCWKPLQTVWSQIKTDRMYESKLFDTLMEFFKTVGFEKKSQQMTASAWNITQHAKSW